MEKRLLLLPCLSLQDIGTHNCRFIIIWGLEYCLQQGKGSFNVRVSRMPVQSPPITWPGLHPPNTPYRCSKLWSFVSREVHRVSGVRLSSALPMIIWHCIIQLKQASITFWSENACRMCGPAHGRSQWSMLDTWLTIIVILQNCCYCESQHSYTMHC